ncbi:MAG: hypothetical protein OXG05_15950 [Gammaproteobacteria bacterium]|nr:hypothetical protein [Gammaproteobacteria bacterium]
MTRVETFAAEVFAFVALLVIPVGSRNIYRSNLVDVHRLWSFLRVARECVEAMFVNTQK